ncbi:hypothetical protein ACH4UR_25425 [Streptomyces lydicus]|uniref:hypothetical protein n=1 Tax=Streptomyces lydicus TaxID=47763 RepID=UPI0033FACE11
MTAAQLSLFQQAPTLPSATKARLPIPPAPAHIAHHVIQFSGGAGSALSAIRVAERVDTQSMTLLIANTQVEDADLWRFSRDVSDFIGVPLTVVADGRDPWQLFHDVRYLGNNHVAVCTKHLKQIPCRHWMEEHAPPHNSIVYVGIEPTSKDRPRHESITRNWAPWNVEYPLLEGPDRTKDELLDELRTLGIKPPRLYELGFKHNNCGGGCVRAGQSQWKHLLETFPDRYAYAEHQEGQIRTYLQKDVSILKRQRNGVTRPLTLAELRREQEEKLA